MIFAHTTVTITENTYLRTTTSGGTRVWIAIPIEYTGGVLFVVMPKLSNTTKTLLNFPSGKSIELIRPPTFLSAYPALQLGIKGADIAAAAPRHWRLICILLEVPQTLLGDFLL